VEGQEVDQPETEAVPHLAEKMLISASLEIVTCRAMVVVVNPSLTMKMKEGLTVEGVVNVQIGRAHDKNISDAAPLLLVQHPEMQMVALHPQS
jgi:hypothetical protein